MDNISQRVKAKIDDDSTLKGCRIMDMSDENGYGSSDWLVKSGMKASGTYNPQPKSADPINYDGLDGTTDERFIGTKSAPPLGSQNSGKDMINTGDREDTPLRSF